MAQEDILTIDLRMLPSNHSLPDTRVRTWIDAAAVMMWSLHPSPSTRGLVHHDEDAPREADVRWSDPEPAALRSCDNRTDATEEGAYGVSLYVVGAIGRFHVLGRARELSGADFVMVREGEPDNDFVKLEVSGIAEGSDALQRARVAQKVAQVRAGVIDRPGFVSVVRFKDFCVLMRAAP